VEWLGQVPEHWEINQGRRLFLQEREPSREGDDQLSATQKYGVVPQKLFMEMEDQKVTLALGGTDNFKHVEKGDFVISLRSFQGGIEHSNYEGCVSPAYTVLRPSLPICSQFWAYLLKSKSYIEALQTMTDGIRDGKNISYQQFGQIRLPVAAIAEQIFIADFLDVETAKIDGLITEQKRLIDLLKEKRQAVISHAVTKGLNPDAAMKDSGIEWLGQVPEHWEVIAMKRDLDFITSGSRGWAENYSDEGELFIRITNLTRGSIQLDLSDIQRVAVPAGAEGSRTKVQAGDILFSITAYLGSVAVVPENLESAYVSQHVALARLKQNLLIPEWVGFVALSNVGKTWFETQSYGGTKIQLSLDDVKDLPITVPPIAEQQAIVFRLKTELEKHAALIAEALKAISLLQERRSALISAAVTGQIDVRGLQQREAA